MLQESNAYLSVRYSLGVANEPKNTFTQIQKHGSNNPHPRLHKSHLQHCNIYVEK